MKFIFLLITVSILNAHPGCAQSDVSSQIVENTFQDFVEAQTTHIYSGSFLPELKRRPELIGNRYLFDKWVTGTVIDTADKMVSNPDYLFNYDKITRSLLVTKDKATVFEVRTDFVKSFELDDDSVRLTFESLSLINNGNFVERLVKGDRYSLYKSIRTRFVKSDYYSDGLTETGSPDDQYVDEFGYYIIFPGNNSYKKVELKKKSFKQALNIENEKVKAYFSEHKYEFVNEELLKGLIVFLNK
jgi:hypothetical protein